jgi:hypothetical protein
MLSDLVRFGNDLELDRRAYELRRSGRPPKPDGDRTQSQRPRIVSAMRILRHFLIPSGSIYDRGSDATNRARSVVCPTEHTYPPPVTPKRS